MKSRKLLTAGANLRRATVTVQRKALGFALGLMILLAGCESHVTRSEFDRTVNELRQSDARLSKEVMNAKFEMGTLHSELDSKFEQQDAKFEKYDTAISENKGELLVDIDTHFDYRSATLREDDKPALDDFASVIRAKHPDVLVTAEGFTDSKGSAIANKRIGLARANAVRDYLIKNGGLPETRVRAVSYGSAHNRQVVPKAVGDEGESNRRVTLVIDYVPPRGAYKSASAGGTYKRAFDR